MAGPSIAAAADWVTVLDDRLWPALLAAAAGSVLVLGFAALAALAMRRRASAAARHQVWLLGVVGVLLLPILSAALPGWHVLPRGGSAAQPPARPADTIFIVEGPTLRHVEAQDPSADVPPAAAAAADLSRG